MLFTYNDGKDIFERHFIVTGLDTIENDKFKKYTETWLCNRFFKTRGEIVKYLNPKFETWNKEFDKQYGSGDKFATPERKKTYFKFMTERMNNFLKQFEGYDAVIKIQAQEEDCDLIGIGKGLFKNVRIEMYFTPVVYIK